ncbi:MAG: 16S rRNA (adenine(1518)-N(6)/adenine(1519)-N(6))-dimethyltransferase RsmA [Pseudomonadota bacterium]
MTASDGLPPLREVIQKHGLFAKKSLGQNFLLDLNLTGRIARGAGSLEGYDIIEVGPGPGGLTRALLSNGAEKVIAIERDQRCLAALAEVSDHYKGKLEIIEGDALRMDWRNLAQRQTKIIANLPYNIATPLLTGWLSEKNWPPFFDSLTLMFQKEVAERICARPGEKHYGRLGVLCGWRSEAHKLFDVSPQAFTPPPKVTSSVVHLTPISQPLVCELEFLERITRAAFGQRRKMLRASLKPFGGETLLEKAGLDPTKRAEEIDVEGFTKLANLVAAETKSDH